MRKRLGTVRRSGRLPQWFVARPEARYLVEMAGGKRATVLGESLLEGVEVQVVSGVPSKITGRPAARPR